MLKWTFFVPKVKMTLMQNVVSLWRMTGPLSTLPPDPSWSHIGGAQPPLQWQLWLLLHSWRKEIALSYPKHNNIDVKQFWSVHSLSKMSTGVTAYKWGRYVTASVRQAARELNYMDCHLPRGHGTWNGTHQLWGKMHCGILHWSKSKRRRGVGE